MNDHDKRIDFFCRGEEDQLIDALAEAGVDITTEFSEGGYKWLLDQGIGDNKKVFVEEDKTLVTLPLKQEDLIMRVIVNSPNGIRAIEIARKLGVDKTEVNHLLYSSLKNRVRQDRRYLWWPKAKLQDAQQRGRMTINEIPATALGRLARYYLDCLSHDDLGGVSVFADSRYDLDYFELNHIPELGEDLDIPDTEDAKNLLNKVRRDRNKQSLFLGYPTRLKHIRGRNNWEGFIAEPLFLIPIEGGGNPREELILSDEMPFINFKALSSLSTAGPAALMEEAIQLSEDLGLNIGEADLPELDELFARLRQIRDEWDWEETPDLNSLSTEPLLRTIQQQGIYNHAIVVAAERSPFTRGLETELKQLEDLEKPAYQNTSVGTWLQGSIAPSTSNMDDKPLLEVLPLNTEQREAVKRSLHQPLTVVTGPPGTGKSQVVTSLIVNAAWHGKTVLFASKNNKAVDVVELRANALGDRPILLRLGRNEYASNLSSYLVSLLASQSTPEDANEYNESEKVLLDIQSSYKCIDEELNAIIQLRNEVDHLEQEVEEIRNMLGEDLFAKVSTLDIESLAKQIEPLQMKVVDADKFQQGFFAKLFWSFYCDQRFESLTNYRNQYNEIFKEVDIVLPDSDVSDITIIEWCDIHDELDSKVMKFKEVRQYLDGLYRLSNGTTLEELSSTRYNLLHELAEASERLWQAWLKLQPSRLSDDQRKTLGEYSSIMQMMVNADQENTRIGRDVFRKYYQLFPKVRSVLTSWAITSLSVRGRIPFESNFFDLLIIDEASQCDIASALPLLYRAKNVVVIGDPNQLRHISTLSRHQDQQLLSKHQLFDDYPGWSYSTTSLFDLAASLCRSEDVIVLRDHHRSHSDIIQFSNNEFYDGRLRVATRYENLKRLQTDQPGVRWIDVNGQAMRPGGGGALNNPEAEQVLSEIRNLMNQGYQGTIGVVSPFRAHANRIRDIVSQDAQLAASLASHDFLVDTVHKFQGDERDIMIFSPVVANGISQGALGFLRRTPNLFNVAITRARAELLVVGDLGYAINCGVDYLERFAAYTQELANEAQLDHVAQEREDLGPHYPSISNPHQVSEWEHILYEALYDAGLRPIPQYHVEKYILDFALIPGGRRLNIEVDGERYHRNWDGELCRRDQLRNQRLIELGWDVMRFWVYQIRDDMEGTISKVLQWGKIDG